MMELTIYGRGGRGAVTLAKLIATAYFLHDAYVQAFGVYGAERTGAPVQAYVRVSNKQITRHWPVRTPDHVVVVDPTLIAPEVAAGMHPTGWLILNASGPPEAFADVFPGLHVAVVDATAIALDNHLGTAAVPIVNTALVGAVARTLGLAPADVDATLTRAGLVGPNVAAAHAAFERLGRAELPGEAHRPRAPRARGRLHIASIFDEDVGRAPSTHTGSWAIHRPRAVRLSPPCTCACPAGTDVRGFVRALAREEPDIALRTLLENSPFPGTCGRVCPAPCMDACSRRPHDEAVNCRQLERYLAARAHWPQITTRPRRPHHVAVIGAGPAGLSAAYQLARLGYPVTVYEAGNETGGLLRTGIPAFRLPRHVVDGEIAFILAQGVEVRTGCRLGREQLVGLARDYAGVVVATGLQAHREAPLDAANPRVMPALDFLALAAGRPPDIRGRRVAVVGGGDTAIDAARVACRLGALEARVLYRRTRAQMPALAQEVGEALAEGISIDELVTPVRLEDGPICARLVCRRTTLGAPDASGRPRPEPLAGPDSLFELDCHVVLLALGQEPDRTLLPEGGPYGEEHPLPGFGHTPVCLAGDLAQAAGTVAAAVGSGAGAAARLHAALTGAAVPCDTAAPRVRPEAVTLRAVAPCMMAKGRLLPARRRRVSFAEVRAGLGRVRALAEAERCFSCGACAECGQCLAYCPEGVLTGVSEAECMFEAASCKGCGLCAAQCPRQALTMAAP